MRLRNRIQTTSDISLTRGIEPKLAGLTADSRNVKPGFLFVTIPGTQQDGRAYIADALTKGAVALLVPRGTPLDSVPDAIAIYETDEPRRALAACAAAFYPRQPTFIAAITGTSGKTSTAQFTMNIGDACGLKTASIGTLGLVTPQKSHYGSLTTPDSVDLHRMLNEVTGEGVTHLALEASSQGIILNRLDSVAIKAAAFTNLSRDHLDYHETMEAYFDAKKRLFAELLPEGATAVLNADIPEFAALSALCARRHQRVIDFGARAKEIRLISYEPIADGQRLSIEVFGKRHDLTLPVIGSFQVWNSIAAFGLALASGIETERATAALEKLSGVPGRLQRIGKTRKGGVVFVDYAHKPGALENMLNGLRPHVAAHKGAKLGVVFGCGGNRDKGKRPLMGAIAQRLADWSIVTDDNPRNEEPDAIRNEILAGYPSGQKPRDIGDRSEAIRAGIESLNAHDVLVIAGKGHESGQIIKGTVHPFNDAAVARSFLEKDQ